MSLTIRPGDIVEAERTGIIFYARVTSKGAGVLDIAPLRDDIGFRSIKPSQVRTLYRRIHP
jgi:hypothetical protein